MSKQGNQSSSGGIGFLGLLAIVFITLKLIGVIDWSWWWVTAPLWGGLALALASGVFVLLFCGVFGLAKKARKYSGKL